MRKIVNCESVEGMFFFIMKLIFFFPYDRFDATSLKCFEKFTIFTIRITPITLAKTEIIYPKMWGHKLQ